MKNNWLWIVGGGIMQVPLIKKAKERGFKVMVTDMNPDAPGMLLADQAVTLSTKDIQGHRELARSSNNIFAGVLTSGADVGQTVSAVSDELGLRAVPYGVAVSVGDKFELRTHIKSFNPHPGYMDVYMTEEALGTRWKRIAAREGFSPYPCVLKPTELSGSRGVQIVKGPFSWDTAKRQIRKHSGASVRHMIAEEMLSGNEYAIDFFVKDGDVFVANAVERVFHESMFGAEIGHINPYRPPKEMIEKAQMLAEATGVKEGPLKVDFMRTEKYGAVIMEAATRWSGGFDHAFTGEMVGKRCLDALINYAIGEEVPLEYFDYPNKTYVACYAPYDLKPGKIKSVNYESDAEELMDIIFRSNEIPRMIDNISRPLFVIMKSTNRKKAWESAVEFVKGMEFEYE